MIKSIVKEVLSRDTSYAAPDRSTGAPLYRGEGIGSAALALKGPNADDEELKRVLASLKTNVKIVGCGGAGCNTINRIVEEGIAGADMYALNSDAQHLLMINSPHKILLGRRTTRGLGAGSVPQVGEEAAMEAEDEIRAALQGADIVFITCGLGGGTGTGSAHIIAKVVKEIDQKALTISVVTQPFAAEGIVRTQNAEWGLDRLQQVSDTTVLIPNDKLLEIVPRLPLEKAFKVADEILTRSIKGITEIITKVGLVNLDFADLKTIMKGGGVAMIGLGESEAEDRAVAAVNEALNSPLLEVDISEATGALINVTGGEGMTVTEAERVAAEVHDRINPQAKIIWGAQIEPSLDRTIRVMLVVTGVKSKQIIGSSAARGIRSMSGPFGIDFVR